MASQAFGIADVDQACEQLQRVNESSAAFAAILHAKRQDARGLAVEVFFHQCMVGVVFTRVAGATVHIDNFVLSCRVFSRGIETACLTAVLADAKAAGADAVEAVYRPGPKNAGVRDLYPDHGFTPTGEGAGDVRTFRHDLADIAAPPEHIRLTASLEESRC